MSFCQNKSKITTAFMPVQVGQNLHEHNSSRLVSGDTGVQQIAPPRMAIFLS